MEADISYLDIFAQADFIGKVVLMILFAASIYVWSMIFKKSFALMKLSREVDELKAYVQKMPKLKKLIVEESSMHFQVYDRIMNMSNYIEDDKHGKLTLMFEEISAFWEKRLEAGLEYLSIVGNISTFIGLFGTVWGIMHSFQSIAQSNSSSISVVAPGISEALFATAVGLFVAIPAVIATSLFYAKIENLIKDMRIFAYFVIERLSMEK